ncbi:ABC transporter permease [Spirochaeta dissipatitropha]
MRRYLLRKLFVYGLTFFVAITLNWMLPRVMPGDPIVNLVSQLSRGSDVQSQEIYFRLNEAFGFDKPLIQQYFTYLSSLFRGDLGVSIMHYPKDVAGLLFPALPYTLILTVPALLLSFIIGNKVGAAAARKKFLDSAVLPGWYVIVSTPYFWLGIFLAWVFAVNLDWFPLALPFRGTILPGFNLPFILNFFHHWALPFLSLFFVQLGGWAIGMRNMIIYELESDYSRYLETLGAPDSLIRRYAFNNAKLPQITGLATQIGMILVGNITLEVLFQYPGIGKIMVESILQQDYFVAQGAFLLLVVAVLIANFLVDVSYAFIDPRVRLSVAGD